ncbi:MAG: hypothetical protein ABJA75_00660 [Bradyrhizobium sp.]
MADFFAGVLAVIFGAINVVLELGVSISRMRRFARWVTGSDAIVEVPEPKILLPAAQRALAEAEARRDGASFIDKYVSPSCK